MGRNKNQPRKIPHNRGRQGRGARDHGFLAAVPQLGTYPSRPSRPAGMKSIDTSYFVDTTTSREQWAQLVWMLAYPPNSTKRTSNAWLQMFAFAWDNGVLESSPLQARLLGCQGGTAMQGRLALGPRQTVLGSGQHRLGLGWTRSAFSAPSASVTMSPVPCVTVDPLFSTMCVKRMTLYDKYTVCRIR